MALLRKEFIRAQHRGHVLNVSVNDNSFCVQCSVMASAALTRDRVLHYLPRQNTILLSQFSRNKQLSAFFNAINCYYLERWPYTEYVG